MAAQGADVIVVGAGVAGLTAAHTVSRAGLSVVVLEARERIGGRVATVHDPASPMPIELGAEFIHGRPSELWQVVRAARLGVYELAGTIMWSHAGRIVAANDRLARIDAVMGRMEQAAGEDRSFADFLETVKDDERLREAIPFARSFVEGFDAADVERIGVHALIKERQASAAVDGDRAFRLIGGYDVVPRWLASGLDPQTSTIRLSTMVTQIRWQRGQVEVMASTRSGQALAPFVAPRVIITLPLGVLQAPAGSPGAIEITPEPSAILDAARRLVMGPVVKVTLRFREPFWEDRGLGKLRFLMSREATFPTWWTLYPVATPLLIGWAAGPAGARLAQLGEAAVVDRALDGLARVLHLPRAQIEALLEASYFHDWQVDPLAHGAYSYAPAGALDAVATLAEPVEDTLFLAGEATDLSGQTGTVHGAWRTGVRAAHQVLARAESRQ